MGFTPEVLAKFNTVMNGGGNLFIISDLDRTNPANWTVKDEPIYVSTRVEKSNYSGNKFSDLKITPDSLVNNESTAAFFDAYTVASSTTTEATKYNLEDNSEYSLNASASDTSKLVYVISHVGSADGLRQSFSGVAQLLSSESGAISTGANAATRRTLTVQFVEAPVKITLPGRASNHFPQLASGAPGYWTKPLYSATTTGDSTRLPFKTEIAAGTFGCVEMWLKSA